MVWRGCSGLPWCVAFHVCMCVRGGLVGCIGLIFCRQNFNPGWAYSLAWCGGATACALRTGLFFFVFCFFPYPWPSKLSAIDRTQTLVSSGWWFLVLGVSSGGPAADQGHKSGQEKLFKPIETRTKWPPCLQIFSTAFSSNFNVLIKISQHFVPNGPIDKLGLVLVMAWCWVGNKPLLELMMTNFCIY